MKKRIFLSIATILFASALVTNVDKLQLNTSEGVTLQSLFLTAKADGETTDTSKMQNIVKTITTVTYKKWDAKLKVWIFSSVGGEGYTQVTKTYSYHCCMGIGPGCVYQPC
jgi:hypothetical protein